MHKRVMGLIAAFAAANLFADVAVENQELDYAAISLGIFNPVQTAPDELNVYGFRFDGIYGRNADVFGLDVGLGGFCTGDFAGLGVTAANVCFNDASGLRVGALVNIADGNTYGINLAPVNLVAGELYGVTLGALCYSGSFYGAQLGVLGNWNSFQSYGLEIGLVNYNQDKFTGLSAGLFNLADRVGFMQLGAVNTAYEVNGLQIGFLNACDELCGLQIGLINIVDESPVPIMPVLNASF